MVTCRAVCNRESRLNCREPLAGYGLKQDDSYDGHLREPAARHTTPPKTAPCIRLEEGCALALMESTNANASTSNAGYVEHWVVDNA